jgi:hypothetical protein
MVKASRLCVYVLPLLLPAACAPSDVLCDAEQLALCEPQLAGPEVPRGGNDVETPPADPLTQGGDSTTGGSTGGGTTGSVPTSEASTTGGPTTGGTTAVPGTTTTGGSTTGGSTTGGSTTGGSTTGGSTTGGSTTGGGTTGSTPRLRIDSFTDTAAFLAQQNELSPPLRQSDDDTMSTYRISSSGSLALSGNNSAYWFTRLAGDGTCFDARAYAGLMFTVRASSNATARVQLQTNDASCTSRGTTQTVDVRDYAVFDGTDQRVFIPLMAFTGLDLRYVRSVIFAGLTSGTTVYIDDLALGAPF